MKELFVEIVKSIKDIISSIMEVIMSAKILKSE
jgi:hypothetical protein